jgi:hypothetical protein
MMDDEAFGRSLLTAEGFAGWMRFAPMRAEIDSVPSTGGVFVVMRTSDDAPAFLTSNPGGRFKDRDSTVSNEALRANWVDGARAVYIGKANQLRRRLRQFADFGAGRPVGHWGGRLIWQLATSEKLLVAWKLTPGRVPRDVEAAMIEDFRTVYGKPPFANEPHRLGR